MMEHIQYTMNKNCGIYKITSPTGKVYIGQSNNLKKRWSRYKSLNCKQQYRIINSLKKHGVENHQFDTIEYCSEDELNCSERFWQDQFDVLGKNGLNCVLTVCGEKRRVLSDEFKKRISQTNTGKKASEETKKKMSDSRKGIPKSEETKKRMSERQKGELNHSYGKKLTENHKQKISKSTLGKKHSEESKSKMSPSKIGENNVTSKLVLNTQTGIFYYCIREASEAQCIGYSKLRDILSPNSRLINKTDLIVV